MRYKLIVKRQNVGKRVSTICDDELDVLEDVEEFLNAQDADTIEKMVIRRLTPEEELKLVEDYRDFGPDLWPAREVLSAPERASEDEEVI